MRIIGGAHRGKRLLAPGSINVRPTTDFAREGLFNLLANRIDISGLKVLDLFCGLGGFSLECLSRGVEQVTAVDLNPVCLKFIARMAGEMNMSNLKLHRQDARCFIERNSARFGLIFADPPYKEDHSSWFPVRLYARGLADEHTVVVLEHDHTRDYSVDPHFETCRHFGNVYFSIFTG